MEFIGMQNRLFDLVPWRVVSQYKKEKYITMHWSTQLCSSFDQILFDTAKEFISRVMVTEYHTMRDSGVLSDTTRELRFAKFQQLTEDPSYINTLFEKYPLLQKLLYARLHDTYMLFTEITENFSEQKAAIESFFEVSLPEITSIETSMGDLHDGKTVCKVFFDTYALYYKPRKLMGDLLFQELMDTLKQSGVVDYKKVKTLCFEDHSWQEPIVYKECNTFSEAKRYYYRAGVMLSLFYVLHAEDLHYENVVAHGEYPVILDYETIASCSVESDLYNGSGKGIDLSCLATALLPANTRDQVFDVSMSGFFLQAGQSNTLFSYALVEHDEFDIAYEQIPVTQSVSGNAVFVHGKVVDYLKVQEDFINGFTQGCKAILTHKDKITDILNKEIYKDLIIRKVIRPTQTYYTFIQSSQHPDMLKDPIAYDNLFDILLDTFEPSKFGYIRVEKEISEMKKGYVPLFYTHLHDTHLYSNGSVVCNNYFSTSPYSQIEKGLANLSKDMIAYQAELIKASLFTMLSPDNFAEETGAIYGTTGALQEKREKALHDFSDRLLLLSISDDQDDTSTMPMVQIDNDRFIFDSLDAGLYFGGGLVLYLSAYAKVFSSDVAKSLATRHIKYLSLVHLTTKESSSEPIDYSLYQGYGGLLYLAYNHYKLHGDSKMYNLAISLVQDIMKQYKAHDFRLDNDEDYLNGFGATMLFLCKLYTDIDNTEMQQQIYALAEKYASFVCSNPLHVVGVAHGLSGQNMVLSHIYAITQNNKLLQTIQRNRDKEQELIEKQVQEGSMPYSWCRGISGILLAHSVLVKNVPEAVNFWADMEAYTTEEHIQNMFGLSNPCLCHGIFGNQDICLTLDSCELLPESAKPYLTAEFFSESDMKEHKWVGDSTYPYEGFMLGVAGVYYTWLRQQDHSLPSVLSLDIYQGEA